MKTTIYCTVALNHFYSEMQYVVYGHVDVLYKRVLVPVRDRNLIGIVISIQEITDLTDKQLREIISVIDPFPLLTDDMAETITQFSKRFMIDKYLLCRLAISPYYFDDITLLMPPSNRYTVIQKMCSAPQSMHLHLKSDIGRGNVLNSNFSRTRNTRFMLALQDHTDLLQIGRIDYESLKNLHKRGYIQFIKSDTKPYISLYTRLAHHSFEHIKHLEYLKRNLNKFNVSLIWSSNRSARLELYIDMIEEVLKNGGQILLFTPTIRSSEDMASILRDRFDIEVQLVNSAPQGFKHYAEALNLIRLGNVRIVVSNRKGILIHFHNLKLIVIEDEHSSNHKHYGTNIYCVREAALIRARILNIPLLMSSSTPSSKTFQKSVEQEYKLLDLSHDQDRPKLEIIDINKQDIDNLRMSSDLHHEIAKTLASHKQVMIFLNRIGYSRKLTCTKCSTNIYCSECKANLTLFLDPNPHFSCRACNKFHYPLDELCCQVCGGNVIMKAMGTEKIEYHMKTKYPDSTVIRVDSKSDYYLQDTIERIERHEVDIIVATELINQKIPFSHIGLICVIDIDYIMLSEDWGDLEKTVGLIVDLAESAGTNARTIIQSSIPGNRYIKALETFDYRVMMDCLNKRLNSLENQIKTYQVNILIQETSKERMVDRAKEIMNYLLANRTNTTDVGRFGLRRKPVISGKWRGYIKVQSEMLDELYNLLKPLRKGHNCRLDFVPENIRP